MADPDNIVLMSPDARVQRMIDQIMDQVSTPAHAFDQAAVYKLCRATWEASQGRLGPFGEYWAGWRDCALAGGGQ